MSEEAKQEKRLHEEARALREALRRRDGANSRRAYPGWKKGAYLVLILGVLAASVVLLIWSEARRSMILEVSAGLFELYPDESRVYDLPAPPPRQAEPVVRLQGPTFGSADPYEGVLYSDSGPEVPASEEEGTGQEEFVPPPRSPESQKAYELLVEQSELVARLVAGNLEGFEFVEWSPLQNDPPRFMIDLKARRDSEEVHLVWQVNIENASIQPMSQAARDLAARR